MYICLLLLVLILNFSIFSILKNENRIKKLSLYVILFFCFVIMITKLYNFLNIENMPEGFGFFILLNFSWAILVLFLFKKIINRRVNLAEQLGGNDFLSVFTYLKVITIVITIFQAFLILSKTIYIFKS